MEKMAFRNRSCRQIDYTRVSIMRAVGAPQSDPKNPRGRKNTSGESKRQLR